MRDFLEQTNWDGTLTLNVSDIIPWASVPSSTFCLFLEKKKYQPSLLTSSMKMRCDQLPQVLPSSFHNDGGKIPPLILVSYLIAAMRIYWQENCKGEQSYSGLEFQKEWFIVVERHGRVRAGMVTGVEGWLVRMHLHSESRRTVSEGQL